MNVTRHVAEVGDAALYLDPGRLPVFRGLSFGLGAGERLAVIGSNGAGKTLLLKSIAGILRLDEGTARVRAESGMVDPRWVPEAVAYISLGSGFHPFLTIREAVTLAGRLVRRWDASLESELTHGFRINVERKCGTLSQGECILLQIVIALCRRPRLVLIDDGLAVLHPENTEFFFKVINRPAFREMGLIFATQNFGLVSTFATAALDLNLAAAADGAGRSSAAVAPRLASQPGEPGLATPCRAEPGLMEPASMKPGSMESR